MRRVAVLGAGSWGTALSVHLARVGHDVRLWARDPALADDMAARRANAVYLPDITFPDGISTTHDLMSALAGADFVVLATPSHGSRAVLRAAAPHMTAGATVVSATKGLEAGTLHRMSEVMGEIGRAHV